MSEVSKQRTLWWVIGGLALLTISAFWPVFHCEFSNFDDPVYVLENSHIQQGFTFDFIRWAFTSFYATNWHPLTWLSHALDWELFGSDPTGHHLVNLAFHVANTGLLFWLLHRVTQALWPSALVAALFAVHPMHVESVAWVAERKDVLSTFFWILTLWAYVRWCEKRSAGRYCAIVLFFLLGLLSKPMLVTLPFLLLLLDFWPLRRTPDSVSLLGRTWRTTPEAQADTMPPRPFGSPGWTSLLIEKLPLLAMALLSSITTLFAQARTVQPVAQFPIVIRVCNALFSYARYLYKMIFPIRLSVHYSYIHVWSFWALVIVTLFFVTVSVIAIRKARTAPFVFVGWFWFIGTLVPTIGLVQVGTQAMADRYSYVPFIGIFIAFAWSGREVLGRLKVPSLAGALVACSLVVACVVGTRSQLRYWHDGLALFKRAVEVGPDDPLSHYNLAISYLERGQKELARSHFVEVIKLNPYSPEARNNLANLLAMEGKPEAAVEHYLVSLRARPGDPSTEYNLALALADMGKLDEADAHFEAALAGAPAFLQTYKDYGTTLTQQRRFQPAVARLAHYVEAKPGDPEGHLFLAEALMGLGQTPEAQEHYMYALRLEPSLVERIENASRRLIDSGRTNAAERLYRTLLAVQPNDADLLRNYGLLLAGQGRLQEATTNFEHSLRIRVDPQTTYQLALALLMQGDCERAAALYRQAAELRPDWPDPLNDLAWLLATSPKPHLRNGSEAVRLAEKACDLSQRREARFLGTLDAAYAEAGRFDQAIQIAKQTEQLASAAGQSEIASAAAARLQLYTEKRPFHQAPDPR